MSTRELENQPAQEADVDVENEQEDNAIPDTKSGVRLDPNPTLQTARFFDGDLVHMSQVQNGQRVKGVFSVYQSQWNSRGYFEYQLIDRLTEKLHKNGAWIRERDLKAEKPRSS